MVSLARMPVPDGWPANQGRSPTSATNAQAGRIRADRSLSRWSLPKFQVDPQPSKEGDAGSVRNSRSPAGHPRLGASGRGGARTHSFSASGDLDRCLDTQGPQCQPKHRQLLRWWPAVWVFDGRQDHAIHTGTQVGHREVDVLRRDTLFQM